MRATSGRAGPDAPGSPAGAHPGHCERYRGRQLGGAVGDALGEGIEFLYLWL
jgi:hypothetical protein